MAKKDFSTVSPVGMFLTQPESVPEQTDNAPEAAAPPQADRAKASEEPRTRRVQLILKKSLFLAMRHAANRQHKSFNHFCEGVFSDYLERMTAEGGEKRK